MRSWHKHGTCLGERLVQLLLQVDKINRQVAARIVSSSAFTALKDYDLERAQMMREQLTRISAENGLSENVFEIVSKRLES